YESLLDKYGKNGTRKKKFGVSTQHYSFAVKTFVEMVKNFNTAEYEFAIRETKTQEVIEDVSTLRSEIGILYLSDFNRSPITKLLNSRDLAFHKLIDCRVYVYLWKGHPLAGEPVLYLHQLNDYPYLSFEQGAGSSFYLAEEIFSTNEYPRMIKANDRATMLNLMVGLNGYTLCSGIICEELNGTDYAAVPFAVNGDDNNPPMEIGYIVKKNQILSKMAILYIQETERYLTERVVR
ncbi:MAG: LysR family transcriptional regulator substrate-binding protein, partial [Eubacteriales bacterium]